MKEGCGRSQGRSCCLGLMDECSRGECVWRASEAREAEGARVPLPLPALSFVAASSASSRARARRRRERSRRDRPPAGRVRQKAGSPSASAPGGARGYHVRASPSLASPAAAPGSMAPKRRAAPGGVWLRAGACLLAWAAFCRLRAGACPAPCACSGTTVDCHGLGLRSVPKNIPRSAERL